MKEPLLVLAPDSDGIYHIVTIHAAAMPGEPCACCNVGPGSLPEWDRFTNDHDEITCRGPAKR